MSHVKSNRNTEPYNGIFSGVYNAVMVYKDAVKAARRDLAERMDELASNLAPGSKWLPERQKEALKAFDSTVAEHKAAVKKAVDRELSKYRKAINEKAAFVNLNNMKEIALVAELRDLSQSEFDIICRRYTIDGNMNYWSARALSHIATEQGLKMPEGCQFANIARQEQALDEIQRNITFFIDGGSAGFLTGEEPGQDIKGYSGLEDSYLRNLSVSDQFFRDTEELYLTGFRPLAPGKMADSVYNQMLNRPDDNASIAYLENKLPNLPEAVKEKVFRKVADSDNEMLRGLLSASPVLGTEYDAFIEKSAGKAEETAGADKG